MAHLIVGLADTAEVSDVGIDGPFTRTRMKDREFLAAINAGLTVTAVEALAPRHREILDVLNQRQHLAWRLIDENTVLATLSCLTRNLPFLMPAPAAAGVAMGEMTILRPQSDRWLLESATSGFASTMCASVAQGLLDPESNAVVPEWRDLLHQAGLLALDEAAAPWWEFHDRYFSSRAALDIQPAGATFRFAHTIEPPPLRFGAKIVDVVELPDPTDTDAGPGIWDVVSSRRCVRRFTERPLSLEDLSLLLHHTLRFQTVRPRVEGEPQSYEHATRAIPSAGAVQSVDLWLWCPGVTGIAAGPWRYDPVAHTLVRGSDVTEWPVPPFAFSSSPLQAILVVNHARLAWKYQRIAYHLGLQDSGVALHALQVSAWAMGLGFHPLGALAHRDISTVLGLDPEREIPVTAFALGWPADRLLNSRQV